ncbi:MAG TPA: T9SS type A sorting domain-containing protein [Pelobium sp.]|nr:T9SS type A sorting domain-containing protein [Pelobium sp.]
MKKSLLYFMLAFISIGANAQTFDWQVLSTAGVGSFTASSLTYSVAYFPGGVITGSATPIGPRLYVATREVGTLDVLNAETGAFIKTITTASVGYKNTKIRATETGEIYSVDMKLASGLSSTGVVITGSYMLDENSTPVAISFPYPDGMTGYPRMGEAFDVVGSGADATFFITGSGSSVVYIYKRNGANIDFVRSVDLGGGIGFCSLSVIPNATNLSNSDFFVSHNTTSVERKFFKYNSGTGTYSASTIPTIIHDQTAPNNFSQLKYFSISGQGYLATTGGSTDGAKNVKIFKITGTDLSDNASFELVRTLSDGAYTYVSGNGGQSDIVFSKNIVEAADITNPTYEFKMYQLVTRNAISAYTLEFDPAGTLPVTLTSFAASFTNNQNSLNWTTSSESNSLGFDVESSTDGVTFSKIGFVASKANGNSTSTLSYNFEDKSASNGTTYYRLKQVDKDGKFEYSDIKYVSNTLSANKFTVYPNPAIDYVDISGADMSGVTLQLFTTSGVELNISSMLEGNRLNISSLDTGIYVLRILKDGQLLQTSKLVKQ